MQGLDLPSLQDFPKQFVFNQLKKVQTLRERKTTSITYSEGRGGQGYRKQVAPQLKRAPATAGTPAIEGMPATEGTLATVGMFATAEMPESAGMPTIMQQQECLQLHNA